MTCFRPGSARRTNWPRWPVRRSRSQLKPSPPQASPATTNAPRVSASAPARDAARRRHEPLQHHQATASTASAAGAFTVTARAARHRAHQGRLVSARATPAAMRLIINASLWIPATKTRSTAGFATPAITASAGLMPREAAARATPHAHKHQTGDDGQSPFFDGNPRMSARCPREETGQVDRSGTVDGGSGQIARIDGREPLRSDVPADGRGWSQLKPDATNLPWAT